MRSIRLLAGQLRATWTAMFTRSNARPESRASDPRREVRYGGFVLFAFFGVFLGWAALVPLDAAIVAEGVVVVSGSRQTVQHRDGGVVSRLSVREGQRVQRGDILIELGAPELIAEERALLAQVLDLEARAASLAVETGETDRLTPPEEWAALAEADRTLAQAVFARYARDGDRAPRSESRARIAGYRAQIVSLDRQETLVEQELDAMRPLIPRGLIPITRVNSLERSIADLQGRQADLRAQIAATQENRVDELRRVRAQLGELLPRLGGIRARLEHTRLRAPSSGVVMGLVVHTVGGVIAPGERILDIVPTGQELIVEANVRPIDADDLSPGQRAEVRVTAFSGRDMPILEGAVRQISADRFEDERTGEGYFVAQIAVPPDEIQRVNGAARQLRAGLPTQVIIPTQARTALQYILEPLSQSVWGAFREA